VLLRHDTTKDAELLNAVLRRQIPGQVRYEPTDRFWFAALSSLLPRRRWREIFPVQPATVLPGIALTGSESADRPSAVEGASHGSGLGKIRRVVERTHPAWLHQFKRLRTRWNAEPTFISD
jgi:hypothetical protein